MQQDSISSGIVFPVEYTQTELDSCPFKQR